MSQDNHDGGDPSTAVFIDALKELLSPEDIEMWFRGMRCIQPNLVSLEIELPNRHYVDWVERRFCGELVAAGRSVFGDGVDIWLKSAKRGLERVLVDGASSNSAQGTTAKGRQQITPPGGGYMKIYYHWLDELRPRVGLTAWGVFEMLVRFIWRGDTHIAALHQRRARRSRLEVSNC